MEGKKKKRLPTWAWILISVIGALLFVWFIQNLIAFIAVMAFLGDATEGTADSIFPLYK